MKDGDMQHFISGLKTVIRRSWPTQEEFAAGITSKVNMSNILRGRSGTSQPMRNALAEKAGMTVEEIIALGKGESPMYTRYEPKEKVSPSFIDAFKLSDMTSSDLLSATAEFNLSITDKFLQLAKDVGETVKTLVDERNRLLAQLSQEQAVINSIDSAVKVVDRNFTIIYCNRAYTELYHLGEDDSCGESAEGDSGGIVAKVFKTGKSEKTLTTYNDKLYCHNGYPVFSASSKIIHVVVVTQLTTEFTALLPSHGWIPPSEVVPVRSHKKKVVAVE
jgi:transcriptional regulator with PAS, ATPase and Fis domain